MTPEQRHHHGPRVAVATQQPLDWRRVAMVATATLAMVFSVLAVMAFSADEQTYSPDAEPPAVFVYVAD